MVVFTDGVKGRGKEEEHKRKKVLLPAFLVPKYPGSSLAATAVLIPVSQYLSVLHYILIESQNSLG